MNGAKKRHIPELDGLRGVAILMVLATHLMELHDAPHSNFVTRSVGFVASLGWCGVDLFFALSGFLITSILLQTRGRPGYFTAFYARRTLRIFPLYYVYLLAVIDFLPRLMPSVFPSHTPGQWMYWTYTSSYITATHSYTLPLSVTWSLAIEEQFYLVWPAVVLRFSRRILLIACLVLMGVALVARGAAVVRYWNTDATYFYTVCRMDGLAAGALAATIVREFNKRVLHRWVPRAAAVTLLPIGVLIAIAQKHHVDVRSEPLARILIYTFTSTLAAATVMWAVVRRPAILRVSALQLFGKYSYSLYLFHMPVRMAIDHLMHEYDISWQGSMPLFSKTVYFALCVGATLALSMLSWTALESPLLSLKQFFPEPVQPVTVALEASNTDAATIAV